MPARGNGQMASHILKPLFPQPMERHFIDDYPAMHLEDIVAGIEKQFGVKININNVAWQTYLAKGLSECYANRCRSSFIVSETSGILSVRPRIVVLNAKKGDSG